MADASVGDEISLEPNGTVRLTLTGTHFRWRRPTFGQFRKFEELWAEVAAEEKVIVDRANAVPEAERTVAWRAGFETELRESVLAWVLDVWRVLCDKEPPATDDCAPWMANASFRQMLKDHWTTVPLAASSR
ncbi:MAG: hypothetical protein QOH66_618 [Actinomycetota bacterium]|jgi:hypothetical protein|nr:hypothetical protein [Actinomycetota bacterium]